MWGDLYTCCVPRRPSHHLNFECKSKLSGMCFHEVIQHLLCFGSSHIHEEVLPAQTGLFGRPIHPSTPSPVARSGAAMPSPPTPRRRRSVSSTPSPVPRSGAALPSPPMPRAPPPSLRSATSQAADDDDESPAFFLHPLPAIVPLIQPSMEEEGVDATAGAAAPQFQAEVSRFRPKWRRLRRKTQDSGVLKPED